MTRKRDSAQPRSIAWLSTALAQVDVSHAPSESACTGFILLGPASDAVRRLYALWETLSLDAEGAAASIRRAMSGISDYKSTDVPVGLARRSKRINHRKMVVCVLLLEELQMTYTEHAHRFTHGSSISSFFMGWTVGVEPDVQLEGCQEP